jgi:MoxR-like ATPase
MQMTETIATINKIIDELSVEFLERHEAIRCVWLCLLSGQHGYLVGPSGTAKSALLAAVTARISGAKYWHIQLDRELDKSESFGQYDIGRFESDKVWERDYSDTFGDCHVALLDEIDKTAPSSLVPYLEMLQGRRFKPGKRWVQAPLISAFGAANATLATSDGALKAIGDRFVVKVAVDYLHEQGNFIRLLQSHVTPLAPANPTTVSLEQLQEARLVGVPAVHLPLTIASALFRLREDLALDGVTISDRKWKAAVGVLQAQAWLAGRCEVADDDLAVLRFVLWERDSDAPGVATAVWAATSTYSQTLQENREVLDDVEAELALRQTQPVKSRAAFARTAMVKLGSVDAAVAELLEQATAQGRDTAPALALRDRVASLTIVAHQLKAVS